MNTEKKVLGSINEKPVKVLISTYNGEAYLREQLESIYAQTYKNYKIYVRDDGSVDRTAEILQEYETRYDNFTWFSGENMGASKSFFDLMKTIPSEDAIYVFADQDDVWLPYKLKHINQVFSSNEEKEVLLYCGDTIVADEHLNILKKENFGKDIKPSFGNALVENICIGCTAAINKNLLNMLIQTVPQKEVMHDWWFYLTASCYGTVIYDEEPLVYYRQHENNVMGSSVTVVGRIFKRLKNHRNHKNQLGQQAEEFSEIFSVDGKNKELLDCVIQYKTSLKKQWKLIKNQEIYRQKKLDDLIFKILFLFKQL